MFASTKRQSRGPRGGIRAYAPILILPTAVALLVTPTLAVPASAGVCRWSGGGASAGCASPSGVTYFAEGTTRNGFEEYILLRNPGAEDSRVSVMYLFSAGEDPQWQRFMLGPGGGVSVCVNDAVGHGRDVSVVVTADPAVVAERDIYFNYKGVWTGGHVSAGVPSPSRRWYFAEGTTREGFQEWLCLQNPSGDRMAAKITYMLGTGRNIIQEVGLPACSRKTVDVNAAVGRDQDVSVKVESEGPIVAERPMYFDYKGSWRGGHTFSGSSGLGRDWYFAEGTTRAGFEEWLCLMNPGPAATARIEYLFDGEPRMVRDYELKAHARTTVFVNEEVGPDRDVSIRVKCERDILCERPLYFLYRGAIEGGDTAPGSEGGAKRWYFPTSAAGAGTEPWLCLMNPGGGRNPVKVEVFGADGGVRRQGLVMGPRSRATIDLGTASAGLRSPWVRVTSAGNVVAERATYFTHVPEVESRPFTIATWDALELKCPIRYEDLLGCVFHEAVATASGGGTGNAQVLQPVGMCLRDDNPSRRHPDVKLDEGGDPAYFVESTRRRGTYSTTACDVQSKAGADVLSPVDGTVLAAEGYSLYGAYPDLRVLIQIDGRPGYQVAVLHMASLAVSKGQRVRAGLTVLGTVRDLVPYFHSGPNEYTREEGNHAHIQINHRP